MRTATRSAIASWLWGLLVRLCLWQMMVNRIGTAWSIFWWRAWRLWKRALFAGQFRLATVTVSNCVGQHVDKLQFEWSVIVNWTKDHLAHTSILFVNLQCYNYSETYNYLALPAIFALSLLATYNYPWTLFDITHFARGSNYKSCSKRSSNGEHTSRFRYTRTKPTPSLEGLMLSGN